jgi:glutaredoxin
MIKPVHVEGRKAANITIYTLSTCGWCKKTKALLQELGLAYDYIDVDLLNGMDSDEAQEQIKKWNPTCSFPTIVINGEECIVGFQEERIRSLAEQ